MDGLFDFLFNNPILLLLVIGWIFAAFREKPTNEQREQQQREQRTRQQRQRSSQQASESRRRPLRDATQSSPGQPLGKIEVERRPVVTSSHTFEQPTVEDQRLEQLEQLQERLGAHMSQIDDVSKGYVSFQRSDTSSGLSSKAKSSHEVTTSQLNKRLNRQGLADSIIMAEVLGKPRAKRIHHRDHI